MGAARDELLEVGGEAAARRIAKAGHVVDVGRRGRERAAQDFLERRAGTSAARSSRSSCSAATVVWYFSV